MLEIVAEEREGEREIERERDGRELSEVRAVRCSKQRHHRQVTGLWACPRRWSSARARERDMGCNESGCEGKEITERDGCKKI